MDVWTRRRLRTLILAMAVGGLAASMSPGVAQASPVDQHRPGHHGRGLRMDAGDVLVSEMIYQGRPGLLTPGVTVLPPGCTSGCITATTDGSYPQVWNNELADANFEVTAPIYLQEMTPSGRIVGTMAVPAGTDDRSRRGDQLVGSFSSKSELALNLSPDGRYVSFMGYVAPANTLDVSNSNTPAVVDPTNPDQGRYYRAAAVLDADSHLNLTATNAFSGDNGRAAIVAGSSRHPLIYAAGNAGNGSTPPPQGIITSTGAQIFNLTKQPVAAQRPGARHRSAAST